MKQQRYFKLNDRHNYHGSIIGDIHPFSSYAAYAGDVYLDVQCVTGEVLKLWFDNTWVKEIFNYTPKSETNSLANTEIVADLVFSSKTHLDNYDAMLDSKGERWIEEEEGLVKAPHNVVDDNGVKCIYRDGIREFETGAVRSDNRGRERYDLIPQLALDMAAEVFGKNCGEFGSGNHLKCLPEAVCIESLLRHEASLRRYLQGVGELNEEDVASMITNVLMLGHTVRAKKLGVYNKIHNW